MERDIRFEPAAGLSAAELTLLWNRAYAGYVVPLVFDEAVMGRHIVRSDIDLERSLVGVVDGERFGLSLAGVRGAGAWIGGFGVVDGRRRRGLASALMAEHLRRLGDGGFAETWLEVIDVNPAREVYRRAGFIETRELLLLGGRPVTGAEDLVALDGDELAAAHARLHATPPTWRRQIETLRHDLAAGAIALGLARNGKAAAFAVIQPAADRLNLLDAAAADEAAGRALLTALARRWPSVSLRLVDEPPDSPLADAALPSGLTVGLRQVEMRVALGQRGSL